MEELSVAPKYFNWKDYRRLGLPLSHQWGELVDGEAF